MKEVTKVGPAGVGLATERIQVRIQFGCDFALIWIATPADSNGIDTAAGAEFILTSRFLSQAVLGVHVQVR